MRLCCLNQPQGPVYIHNTVYGIIIVQKQFVRTSSFARWLSHFAFLPTLPLCLDVHSQTFCYATANPTKRSCGAMVQIVSAYLRGFTYTDCNMHQASSCCVWKSCLVPIHTRELALCPLLITAPKSFLSQDVVPNEIPHKPDESINHCGIINWSFKFNHFSILWGCCK